MLAFLSPGLGSDMQGSIVQCFFFDNDKKINKFPEKIN